jgi:hypothetical protein
MQSPMPATTFCGAKTRKGSLCRSLPMANGRCRMHGGASPGAPKGNRNAVKHGLYSAEIKRLRAMVRAFRGEALAVPKGR